MVKCAECGFLAVRRRSTWRLEETEAAIRATGAMPNDPLDDKKKLYQEWPACFVGAADFRKEGDDKYHPTVVEGLITKDRQCSRFMSWVRGFDPKEHAQMLNQEQIERLQDARIEADRRWQESRAAEDWKRQEEWASKASRREWRIAMWTLFLGAMLGFLLSIAGPPFKEAIGLKAEKASAE
jgi:hypothetical protein